MRLEFTSAKWQQDDGGFWVSLKVENPFEARRFLANKKDKKYVAEVKEYREKRSLDANAYAWVLLDKLAAVLNRQKTEVYRQYIREIGGNSETVCVVNQAVGKLCAGWERNGLGWLTDTAPSKLDGCTNVILYYGSSTYDTAQMSRLINMIVEDCKAQGVETLTPAELARLTEDWQ